MDGPVIGEIPTIEMDSPHPALDKYYLGSKQPFVKRLFDRGARDYDRVESIMALGTGSWYRRKALRRAGLQSRMMVLDVAVGTGLVAREAVRITGSSRLVFGVDLSHGMLEQACKTLDIRVVGGVAERLPVRAEAFDFLSMGYALRHVSDLRVAFTEFHRALKPGGKLCLLEMTRASGRLSSALLRIYIRRVVPFLALPFMARGDSRRLWEYYWETIQTCVSPDHVIHALESAGFQEVSRHTELGVFSEFTATKPPLA